MPSKLKRSSGSPKPFSWTDLTSRSPTPDAASLPPPPTAWLSSKDFMKVFGARPLTSTSDIGVVRCKDCEKPVLRSCMVEHATNCATLRARKGKSGVDVEGSKKRKASPEMNDPSLGPAKKKTKPTPKVTKGRGKGPVDLDRQCGVINDKGLPCSRSLTCKSHSMGAKRAVEGRSRPYNDLLLDWQREHNPNFVEPVKRESKAEKKERKEREKEEKKKLAQQAAIAAGLDPTKKNTANQTKKATKKTTTTGPTARLADAAGDEVEENLDELDSEAEVDELVHAIRTAREKGVIAQPLAVPCDASSWFVQRRERARVCRDFLVSALGGGGGTGGPTAMGLNRSGIVAGKIL